MGRFLGRAAIWVLSVVFPMVMAVGGAIGVSGLHLPGVETGIALSAIVLGAVVAFALWPPLWVAAVIVGTFAIFHGYAHGVELPSAADPIAYSVGFVIATGLLHLGAWAAEARRLQRARKRSIAAIPLAPIATAIGLSVLPRCTRFSHVPARRLLPPRLLGVGAGAPAWVVNVVLPVEQLKRPWMRVLVRVVGSWATASCVLVLALALALWFAQRQAPEREAAPSGAALPFELKR